MDMVVMDVVVMDVVVMDMAVMDMVEIVDMVVVEIGAAEDTHTMVVVISLMVGMDNVFPSLIIVDFKLFCSIIF